MKTFTDKHYVQYIYIMMMKEETLAECNAVIGGNVTCSEKTKQKVNEKVNVDIQELPSTRRKTHTLSLSLSLLSHLVQGKTA